MIGSFLSRALALVLGYAYPAYECFKVVELNKPEIEQLRFWCQYWILVAVLTVFERVGDAFISWLPMYSEAKLAFFVYLWYPKTKGTSYVYDTFFRPYVAKHETEIDRNLLELRTRAGDMVIIYWQRAATYGQTRFFDILQYVASQSTAQSSRPRPAQQRQQPQQTRQAPAAPGPVRQPAVPQAQLPPQVQQTRQAPVAPGAVRQPTVPQTQLPPRVPASPTKSQGQEASAILPAALRAGQSQTSSGSVGLAASETSRHPATSEVEAMPVEVTSAPSNGDANPASLETPMEEAIRMTRGRLRKRAAAGADSAA